MEPFVVNPQYPVIICANCQFAVVIDEAASHLRVHHASIAIAKRASIVEMVRSTPGIIQSQAELTKFRYPEPTTQPVPHIAAPQPDGIRCRACPYVCRRTQVIQRHCRAKHGWVNEWQKGGNVRRKAKTIREVPWTTGVWCQRFFPSRGGSQWFEVSPGPTTSANRSGAPEAAADESTEFIRMHEEQEEKFEASTRNEVSGLEEKLEPNTWLRRVGWAECLQGLDKNRLWQATQAIKDDETTLHAIWTVFQKVADQARAVSVAGKVGHDALFEAERRDISKKPRRPFDNRMEADTWERYKEVWRKMIGVWYHTGEWPDKERPPYRLTIRQGTLWDTFTEAMENNTGDKEEQERMCLDAIVALIEDPWRQSHQESAMISALAVLGIREDGGWHHATEYTTNYSAVIKMAKMLVVYQAWLERQDEMAEMSKRMEQDEAYDQARSVFQRVRDKVQRFMTRMPGRGDDEPRAMNWIYEARAFGMHIRFNTVAAGRVHWKGDQISYRRVQFRVCELAEMFHTLTAEARGLLARLTAATPDDEDGPSVDRSALAAALPAIAWSDMHDDHTEDRPGYSFLRDDRNEGWAGKGRHWIARQIARSEARRQVWWTGPGAAVEAAATSAGQQRHRYRERTVCEFRETAEAFRERLWTLMHMVAGQPGRAPEIAGIRHSNTVNGGVRNVFVHDGMVCFVTSYHKNYRQTGDVKVIHRYMPREVGELLVWYLWLVLPFWQQVEGIMHETDQKSAFLWADEVVVMREAEAYSRGDKEDSSSDSNSDSSRRHREPMSDTAVWKEERVWTSDKARRIMQQHSERLLGSKINISAWRHIAIAIANRYLHEAFKRTDGFGGEDDDGNNEDEFGVEDSAVDLQSGHGTRLAGMIYGRLYQEAPVGTAAMRERFRGVSRKWHRLFGLGAEDGGGGASSKRRMATFEEEWHAARQKRFTRLQSANAGGQLRQMMGVPQAAFRGQQEAVIRAIMRGDSPVVQVTGTGGGKSLSFMLPAYCAPDGVTIVVTPLVALRSDMDVRCGKAGIRSTIWQGGRASASATIVFVTPESAVTEGFRDYVGRLQQRQQVDRVVLDECHVVLDGSRAFRPTLRALGRTVQEFGAQLVCLTATLPPGEEKEFFAVTGMQASRVRMFREATTRKNIQYQATAVDETGAQAGGRRSGRKGRRGEAGAEVELSMVEEECCRVVRQWSSSDGGGKAVVYGGTVQGVERLAEALDCPAFHSRIDTTKGKAARLERWRGGDGREGGVIVATNALGLGIDVPDVRLVVHAGMPRRLRDFVQESGRAGRDGCRAMSVVVYGRGSMGEKQGVEGEGQREGSTRRFVSGDECRRVVLDEVMDGRVDRSGCEEGEEACDVCQPKQARRDEAEDGARAEEQEEEKEIQAAFERSQQATAFQQWAAKQQRRQGGEEAERFRRHVAWWAGRCTYCGIRGRDGPEHVFGDCPGREEKAWGLTEKYRQDMEREMFSKRRMEEYSCCFDCGLPQAWCQGWKASAEDGGRFRRSEGARCQYGGVLVEMFAVAVIQAIERYKETVQAMRRADGLEDGACSEKEIYQWFGRQITWGGVQASTLCQLTGRLWQDGARGLRGGHQAESVHRGARIESQG